MPKDSDIIKNIENVRFTGNDFSICIDRIDVFVFQVPISKPVLTSFGIMKQRPAVLVRLEESSGAFGWGEVWCNFPSCGAAYRAALVSGELSSLTVGKIFKSPREMFYSLSERTAVLALQSGDPGALSQTIAAFDIAAWDLVARRFKMPLFQLLGGEKTGCLQPYASGINPDAALQTIERCRKEGYRFFKVKVGFATQHDLDTVDEVSRNLESEEHLMIDANQSWTLEEALFLVDTLNQYSLEWIEEPMRSDTPWSDWIKLSEATDIPIALGENLRGWELFGEAIQSSAVTVVQPDICKWGGFTGCLPVALSAISNGKRYCPHYLGGGIGLLASAHLLAAVGGDGLLEVDCNPNPLKNELATPFPSFKNGLVRLSQEPGLGVQPDLQSVRSFIVKHDQITQKDIKS